MIVVVVVVVVVGCLAEYEEAQTAHTIVCHRNMVATVDCMKGVFDFHIEIEMMIKIKYNNYI